MGVFTTRDLLFGVYVRAPDFFGFWKLPKLWQGFGLEFCFKEAGVRGLHEMQSI